MRLEVASPKAIKYSCMNFHYSKSNPNNAFGYSVFNDNNEFCGVVLFGCGANNNLGKSFGLVKGEFAELVRVALNGKQEMTSKVLSLAIKIFKKQNKTVKLLISYADNNQTHTGIIYQATNWYYVGDVYPEIGVKDKFTGEIKHNRTLSSKYGSTKGFERIKTEKPKYKYIYPLDKSLILLCESLKKPYPKKEV